MSISEKLTVARSFGAGRGALGAFTLLLVCQVACGQSAQSSPTSQGDLTQVSIESLMNIEVTSASRKTEALSAAPAAIFVITGEDIRRGGFSSVPDALRQVPGLHVAQQNAHLWVVAARGFGVFFNNKMLVLIDGRIVYTPTFGGVWWDVQDPPLDDIDRIEVIRGPGGTLWGANAVNGVINIITKESAKTQEALVSTSAGANEGYAAHVRYGGKAGEHLTYRIYGTSNYWLPSVNGSGAENYDTWAISQGGARFDWNASKKDVLTFDGEGYSGRDRDISVDFDPQTATLTAASNFVTKGGHLLGKWTHDFSERSKTDVLGYCDWTVRSDEYSGEDRDICDFELQHSYSFTNRQALTWGGSILTTGETPVENISVQFNPPYRRDTTYSAFAQYDVMVVPDKLRVIAGSKFEHNNYTGFEYQPQIRAVWTPKKTHTAWLALSRAVRTPTRVDSDVKTPVLLVSQAPPTVLVLEGDPNLDSEVLHAYEAGYRYDWKQKLAVDVALYYNGYDHLIGTNPPGAPFINPNPFYSGVPVSSANLGARPRCGSRVNRPQASGNPAIQAGLDAPREFRRCLLLLRCDFARATASESRGRGRVNEAGAWIYILRLGTQPAIQSAPGDPRLVFPIRRDSPVGGLQADVGVEISPRERRTLRFDRLECRDLAPPGRRVHGRGKQLGYILVPRTERHRQLEGNSEWFLRFISSNAPILLNGKARVAFTRYFRLQS